MVVGLHRGHGAALDPGPLGVHAACFLANKRAKVARFLIDADSNVDALLAAEAGHCPFSGVVDYLTRVDYRHIAALPIQTSGPRPIARPPTA